MYEAANAQQQSAGGAEQQGPAEPQGEKPPEAEDADYEVVDDKK